MRSQHRDEGADADEWFRRMQAPDNEVPVAVPLTVVLARTEDVALALVGLQVFSTGLAMTLTVRARSEALHLDDVFWQHQPGGDAGDFLFGVQFPDGRWATSTGSASDGVVLSSGGGGGGDRAVDQTWWLHPLPPPGPLTLVLRCPALGIDETQVTVDGTPIRSAAEQVVELWPWTPPTSSDEQAPTGRGVLADSWFAR